jgi:hypothetical protein
MLIAPSRSVFVAPCSLDCLHDVEPAEASGEEPVDALRQPVDVEPDRHFLGTQVPAVLASVEHVQGGEEAFEVGSARLGDDVDVFGAAHVAVRCDGDAAAHEEVDVVFAQNAEQLERLQACALTLRAAH